MAAPMQRANAVLSNNLPVCIIVLAKLVEKVFLREREKLKNVFSEVREVREVREKLERQMLQLLISKTMQ